jgi:hypothetical protein
VKKDPLRKRRYQLNLQNLNIHSFFWEGGQLGAEGKQILFNISEEDFSRPTQDTITSDTFFKTSPYPPAPTAIPKREGGSNGTSSEDTTSDEDSSDDDDDEIWKKVHREDETDEQENATDPVIMFDWENMSAFTSPSLQDPLIRAKRSSMRHPSKQNPLQHQ